MTLDRETLQAVRAKVSAVVRQSHAWLKLTVWLDTEINKLATPAAPPRVETETLPYWDKPRRVREPAQDGAREDKP